jgi:molybdenum cofactor cytidylyltransferase
MFDCVILAAGASSRMGGSLFKPLLSFRGSTLVETAARAALDAGCRVLLVVGNRGGELAALFEGSAYVEVRGEGRLLIVENARWAEGMVGSIQAALSRVSGEAFFVAHGDMPFVSEGDYRALASARAARMGRLLPELRLANEAAIFASCGGLPGHPVLLPSAWMPEILALGRGGALKPFLEARPRLLVETGPGALRDIDTPDDYRKALRSCGGDGTG